MTAGKGSRQRPTDAEAFNKNFDAIFKKHVSLEEAIIKVKAHCQDQLETLKKPRTGCQGGKCNHSSDCAVHNEPAYPAGPCDCKPPQGYTAEELERDNPYNQWMNEE